MVHAHTQLCVLYVNNVNCIISLLYTPLIWICKITTNHTNKFLFVCLCSFFYSNWQGPLESSFFSLCPSFCGYNLWNFPDLFLYKEWKWKKSKDWSLFFFCRDKFCQSVKGYVWPCMNSADQCSGNNWNHYAPLDQEKCTCTRAVQESHVFSGGLSNSTVWRVNSPHSLSAVDALLSQQSDKLDPVMRAWLFLL